MKNNDKIIKSNLRTLVKKFSKVDVVSSIEKNYSQESIKLIDYSNLYENEYLKKIKISDKELDEIETSIKENGLLNPLLVRSVGDKFEIITGRKRYLGSKKLNIDQLPCVIKKESDEEVLLILLADARDHRVINMYEIATICRYLNAEFGYRKKDLSIILKQSISQVSNIMQLLNLPQHILDEISTNQFSFGHARAISRLEPTEIEEMYKKIKEDNLSVRETEKMVRDLHGNFEKVEDDGTIFNDENMEVILKFKDERLYKKYKKKAIKLAHKDKINL